MGEHFGDDEAYSCVRFGASNAPVSQWTNEEILVKAPDDFGLGLGFAKDTLNLALYAISIGSKTLLDFAIDILDALTPDIELGELEWNEDDPLYIQFGIVVAALVVDQIHFCTITVKPSGDLVVPVTVRTGVGESETHFFTFTPVAVPTPEDDYDLTISSTAGGTVTTPGEGTSTHDAGTVVDLVATPASGYRFVNWTGDVGTIANINAASTTITMIGNYFITANFGECIHNPMVASGYFHTVGLKCDGTVVAVGAGGYEHDYGQCDVDNWTGITQVAAGGFHTVGLKSNGTVVATGLNYSGQCNVGNWTDIIQVAAGWLHTVGLESDDSVVAAGPEVELAKWHLL
jgi:hypothetical protein